MGDTRRFLEFARLIGGQFTRRDFNVADIAGGRGSLRAALRNEGFGRITTFDPRQYAGRDKPRPARVRRCDPGQSHMLRLFDYRREPGYNLVVAMHPDGGTDHAVMYASTHQVPAVICPCCIMPSAAPYTGRQLPEQWRRHLVQLAKGMTHRWVTLPIKGANEVLILTPRGER